MLRIRCTLVCAVILTSLTALSGFSVSAELKAQDNETPIELREIVVKAVRITDSVPMAYSEISKKQIEKVNLGQDIPILMNFTPSLVSTTYDGTGVGYTDYRIRGIDNSRINVTINGVPYNDADSQTTFFVNLQDFASSLGSIQIQRGVGASTYGAAAFGASVSLATATPSEESFTEYSGSVGSYGTLKNTLQFGTGMHNGFALQGRLSTIESDGYVDRASADLKSYFLNAAWQGENNASLNLIAFGGTETTGLSFYGLDRARLTGDRTQNDDGVYYDAEGNERVYPNQTDNYAQDHLQLHYQRTFDNGLELASTAHYTNSRGYYEQIQDYDNPYVVYRSIDLFSEGADYASRAHLDSDFFGVLFSLSKTEERYSSQVGFSANAYLGDQYGRVMASDADVLSQLPYEFYRNETDKREWSVFYKYTRQLGENLSLYADVQSRNIQYEASGSLFSEGARLDVEEAYHFFNPKVGFIYDLGRSSLYASFARAHREPARVDFENGNPKAERLDNVELGYRTASTSWQVNIGAFYMNYQDQLVLTGALDAFNFPIRENVGSSYRAGLEADVSWMVTNRLTWSANATLSRHRNRDFVTFKDGSAQSLGDTHISFAPEVISGSRLEYSYANAGSITLYFKHVSSQYMSNIEHEESRINAYSVVDLNVAHGFTLNGPIQQINFSLQVNNVLNELYENNGYFYSFDDGGVTYYGAAFYPQAPRNILVGVSVRF